MAVSLGLYLTPSSPRKNARDGGQKHTRRELKPSNLGGEGVLDNSPAEQNEGHTCSSEQIVAAGEMVSSH